jgi:hypothetical protein
MSDKILTSVARKRSFPKGCNWAPSSSDEVESKLISKYNKTIDKVFRGKQINNHNPICTDFLTALSLSIF